MLSRQVNKIRGTAFALSNLQVRLASQHLKNFASMDPKNLTPNHKCMNLVNGEWVGSKQYAEVVDPMTGNSMVSIPDTQVDEIEPFVESLKKVPRYGLHNPLLNVERYLMLGKVCTKATEVLHDPAVFEHFVALTQRACPKSYIQTAAEIRVTRNFFENFGGDQVRFLA